VVTALRHTALLALSFAFTDRRFLDESSSLFCVIVVFQIQCMPSIFGQLSAPPRIEIDLRIGKRLCDRLTLVAF
jgi:hypothetical protein